MIITLPAIDFDDSDGRRRPSSESSKAWTSVKVLVAAFFPCGGLFSSRGQHVAGLQETRSRVHQYSIIIMIIIIIIMIIIKIIKNK